MKLAETQEEILQRLKKRGPQTIKILANQLDMTTMGVRQHITDLAQRGLVAKTEETRQTRGRPVHYWQLTANGHARFPDTHAEVGVALIESVRSSQGESGLEQLISAAHAGQLVRYQRALEFAGPELEARLARLAELRSEDGFMAEIRLLPDGWLLIENHCPLIAMATACQSYCQAELTLLQSLLADQATIQRTDHLLSDNRRCAYKIQQF